MSIKRKTLIKKQENRVVKNDFYINDFDITTNTPNINGKKAELTAEFLKRFVKLLKSGIPVEDACDLLGFPSRTHSIWLKKGKDYITAVEEERLENIKDNHKKYAVYYKEVKKASANFRKKLIYRSLLPDEFVPTWVRDITILERRDRDNWGRNSEPALRQEDYDPDESFL